MRRFLAAFLVITAALAGGATGAPNTPNTPNTPNPPNAPNPPKPNTATAPNPPKPTTPSAPKEEPILVGVAGPMSGPFAFIGEQMKRGGQQAIDDLNAKGGVLGKKLKLAVVDDGCDAQRASGVATQLVQQKAALVVGHFCSDASIHASAAYAQAGILQITPA